MSQHDYNIANQGFPNFRTDLNNALGAIATNNSGSTAPTTTFAHQWWLDTSTTPNTLRIRNADNDAWVVVGTVNQTDDTFVFTPAAGSASAPAYSVTGDANTGIFFPAADTIAFAEGGAEAMRIDSSGNVGIGTSSPSHRLHVVSNETANPITTIHATNASYNDYNLVSLATRNTTNNSYYFFRCRVSGVADRLVVADSGALSTAGSIQIGDAGAPPTSGIGIKFPATQSASSDANTLDDYEEGTWTVTLTCGTSGTITMNSSYNTGYYTKVGRQVFIQLYCVVSSVSSPVGRLRVNGLPFTINVNSPFCGTSYVNTTNAYTGVPWMISNAGTTQCFIDRNAGTGADSATDLSNAIKANSEIYLSFSYFV